MTTFLTHIYLATGNAHKAEEIGTLLRDFGAPCEVLSAQALGGMPEVDENADSFEGNARLKAQALLARLRRHTGQAAATARGSIIAGQDISDTRQHPNHAGQDSAPVNPPPPAFTGQSPRTALPHHPLPLHSSSSPDRVASPLRHFSAQDHLALPQSPVCYILADDSGLSVEALGGAPGIHSARYAGAGATDAANNALLLKNLAAVPPEKRAAAFVCCFVLLGTDGSEAVFHGRCEGRIAARETGSGGFGYDPLFIPDGYAKSFAELGSAIKNTLSHRTLCCRQLANSPLLRPSI